MKKLFQCGTKILKTLLFVFSAGGLGLLTVVGWICVFGYESEWLSIKRYGAERDRFYILLSEYAMRLGGVEGFGGGYPGEAQKKFESLLLAIDYKKDCTQGTSTAIEGMSCNVNGINVDYIEDNSH